MCDTEHLKRLALQIASQLPESSSEALYVLELTRDLMEHLQGAEGPEQTANLHAVLGHPQLRLVPADVGVIHRGPLDKASPV